MEQRTFSSRLRTWAQARQSAGDEWTPTRFERQTGVARVYWSYWLRADERLAKGEKVVACHTAPTLGQMAKILGAMPEEFTLAFDAPKPQTAERPGKQRCRWCGEPLFGRSQYCNDWHYALAKVAQRQATRQAARVARAG